MTLIKQKVGLILKTLKACCSCGKKNHFILQNNLTLLTMTFASN